MNKRIVTSALSLALLVGVAAASQGENEREAYYERRGPVPFEVLDINKDGVVTTDEHAQVHRERVEYRAKQGYPTGRGMGPANFEQIDKDGNGSISREELNSWRGQRAPRCGMGWNR